MLKILFLSGNFFFLKVLVFVPTSHLHIKEHVVKGKKLGISEFVLENTCYFHTGHVFVFSVFLKNSIN